MVAARIWGWDCFPVLGENTTSHRPETALVVVVNAISSDSQCRNIF